MGWTDGWHGVTRELIARQMGRIRHWRVIEGEYHDAPDVEATWYIDPPYNNRAGRRYPEQPDDFNALGDWCRTRRGLVMVCENEGADWLPFKPLSAWQTAISSRGYKRSSEVIWLNRRPRYWSGVQTSLLEGA